MDGDYFSLFHYLIDSIFGTDRPVALAASAHGRSFKLRMASSLALEPTHPVTLAIVAAPLVSQLHLIKTTSEPLSIAHLSFYLTDEP